MARTGSLALTTCSVESAKSITRRPSGAVTYASRMFHSCGTVQSKIWAPLGTSVRVSGMCSETMSKVARTPSPVRLRQSGNSRSISW